MAAATRKKKQALLSPDRKKWAVIFNALKQILHKQQSQLDYLVEERTLLEQRVRIEHERRISDYLLSEEQISQMQMQLVLVELAKSVEIARADLATGSKQRDAFVYKRKLDCAQSELNDFKAWFDILSHRCPDQEDIPLNELYERLQPQGGRCSSSKEASKRHFETLEKEVVMLKREYEKLSVKNSSVVSALQAEINFVWNQYKEMESNYTSQLQSKNDEINQANEKIKKLLDSMEQLQSSNIEKDEILANLRITVSKLEAEVNQKDGDISKLSKEVESLRSTSTGGMHFLKHCSSEPSSSRSRRRRNCKKTGHDEETFSSQPEDTIGALRAKLIRLETELSQKEGQISDLSKELELSRSEKHCTSEPSSSSGLKGKKRRRASESTYPEEKKSSEVATLRAKIAELEAEANRKNEDIFTLVKRIESLKSKSALDTPVLKRCRGEPSSLTLRDRKGKSKGEEASSAQLISEQGCRRSKRKQGGDVIETPRLFTSQFKIPKLKSQSPHKG